MQESPMLCEWDALKKYFVIPDLKLEGEKKFSLGYRLMCRFNMYHIWDEVKEYSHILRVDEDIEILKFDIHHLLVKCGLTNRIAYFFLVQFNFIGF